MNPVKIQHIPSGKIYTMKYPTPEKANRARITIRRKGKSKVVVPCDIECGKTAKYVDLKDWQLVN